MMLASRFTIQTARTPRTDGAGTAPRPTTGTFGPCESEHARRGKILGDVDAAVYAVDGFAAQADDTGVDLLLFPECFLQGYVVTQDHVHEQALEVGSTQFATVLTQHASIRPMLVLGVIERERNRYYNTAVVIAGGQVVGTYRNTYLTGGESVFTPGDAYPIFDCGGIRFGINTCSDTQFPPAAAAVAAGGAQVLLVPAQNMMRRDKAFWWQERHNQIRVQRVLETGLWLVSADVTGDHHGTRLGLGPTCAINPDGQVVT
jgi:predicted amidohydrolase